MKYVLLVFVLAISYLELCSADDCYNACPAGSYCERGVCYLPRRRHTETEEPETEEPETEEPETEEPETEEPETEEPVTEEPETEEPETEEPETEEPETEEPETEEPESKERETEEPESKERETEEPESKERETEEPQTEPPTSSRQKPEFRQLSHRPVNHRPVNHRPVNHRPVNHRPVNHRPVNHRPVNHRPVGPWPSSLRQLLHHHHLDLYSHYIQHRKFKELEKRKATYTTLVKNFIFRNVGPRDTTSTADSFALERPYPACTFSLANNVK
ncbi:unnamed protein product [Callosobruchus maculatus]|uniref:Uncharacterized protein n=1 Tax=Callosobruchus maculatus TaxID=64391 RepID=A0A653CJQ1_CALMS|nr:unnamed protein product [Callosobruchus maculatus]